MTDTRWVTVPNWDQFQHYKDRNPPWIKLHVELNSDDDWLALSTAARGMLTTIWVEYARSRGLLRAQRVMYLCGKSARSAHLEALNDAGFIVLTDSRPQALARSREERQRDPAKAGSLSNAEETDPAPPLQAAAPEPRRPSALDLARTFVRHAGWQDPHLERTLREDRPELTTPEIGELLDLAATMRGEQQTA